MSGYRRIYVKPEFAKRLKVLAAENNVSVIDLTNNIDVSIKECKKKKWSGFVRL